MAATPPPEQPMTPPPPPPPGSGYGGYGGLGRGPTTGAILPVPGNAEFLAWFVVEIVLAIIWAASSTFGAHGFAWTTAVVTSAYLISRGIAKASRVLEQ
jgi:hypothetical protein